MSGDGSIRLAVVTGGHSYDVVNFHKLFRALGDLDVYIQHMDDFASTSEEGRDAYDVVVFYIMLMDGPKDEGLPWYCGKPRTALEHLGATEQGILVLHHAILAYPQCGVWNDIVGINGRKFSFHIGQSIHVDVANTGHPITKDLQGWDMGDEIYTMNDASPASGSEILLSVNHPKSMKHIAWTRQHGKSRVFNFQSGHDNTTWVDANFRQVLSRGIAWCAGPRRGRPRGPGRLPPGLSSRGA